MLNAKIKNDLLSKKNELESSGIILSKEQLDKYYSIFQTKFSPEILQSWNSETLLTSMHLYGDKESLAYWLEFKNDDELPFQFGSIAGGSALKYGLYFNKEKRQWFTGSSTKQNPITTEKAIDIVKSQRDQLLKGYNFLKSLPMNATEEEYIKLQKDLEEVMPDIVDYAWSHKYLAMHFPDKLDDFHSAIYQKYHLLKILIRPHDVGGKYENAYFFVQAANDLAISINSLTTILNKRNGKPIKYWRLGTTAGNPGEDRFYIMNDNSNPCIAIGWDEIKQNLSFIDRNSESKENLRKIVKENYPDKEQTQIGKYTQQIFNFLVGIEEDDCVVCMDGQKVRGIGKVTSPYYYELKGEYFRHRKSIKWLSLDEWKMNEPEGLRTTVHQFKKNIQNILDIESRIQLNSSERPIISGQTVLSLQGFLARLEAMLKRKGQIILYGPPGTGKTFWANKAGSEIASIKNFNKKYSDLNEDERKLLHDNYVRLCTFHPAYGYEDFIEAYRPVKSNSNLVFELKKGIFRKICKDATENPEKDFLLIIDEINRGDIPRIFGELLTLLELDKRGKAAQLPVSGESFSVPLNVYVIATMNTADRSIALLDTALRRRFGFIEMMPDYNILKNSFVDDISLEHWLKILNKRIRLNLGSNGRNLQIGHSYLLLNGRPISDQKLFLKVVREDIIPLLEEYCYENYLLLEKILSKDIVNAEDFEINQEIFEEGDWEKIKQALKLNDPEILSENLEITEEPLDEDNDDE